VSSQSDERVRGLLRDWTAYTVKWTDQITAFFVSGNYEDFWRTAEHFINMYPPDVKKEVQEDVAKTNSELRKFIVDSSEPIRLGDYYWGMPRELRKQRAAIILMYGLPTWFKFQDVLSRRGYKEVLKAPVPRGELEV